MGKLVRDRIPEIMRADGREPDVRVMDDQEYLASLFDKLLEEAEELRQAPPEQRMEEAADVYEVLCAIAASLGIDIDGVRAGADQKRRDRGGFSARIWLERW